MNLKQVTEALENAVDDEVNLLVSRLNNSKSIIWNFTDEFIHTDDHIDNPLQAKTAYMMRTALI